MTGLRRTETSVVGVVVSVLIAALACAATAGAATAHAYARGDGADPQAWMIVGGLATVPIALFALAALLRHAADTAEHATDDATDDDAVNGCGGVSDVRKFSGLTVVPDVIDVPSNRPVTHV